MQTWRDKHPGYEFKLWGNEEVAALDGGIERLIGQMWGAERWHGVADLVRYAVLYEHGGFAAPADSECLQPIDDLLHLGCFACYENEDYRPGLVSPHLGVCPQDRLMAAILRQLQLTESVLDGDPWMVTGNGLLTRTIEQLNYKSITILPSYTFIPEHYEGTKYEGPGKVYARHYWGTTHHIEAQLDSVLECKSC